MAAFRALPSPSQSPPSLAAEQALKPPASRQTDPLSGSNTTTPAATGQASRRPSFHEFVSYFGPQDDEQTIERGATTTFQFVNTTKNRRRPTPGVITLARSHVARGSHQNETARTSQHQDPTQPSRRKAKRRVVPDELRIEAVPLSARGTMEISPPPPGMAKALFGSPVEVREGDQIMIDHCMSQPGF
ncbi:hypothetical protein FH972_023387 [Carpinus fangiana]|uniref:Uncharacterized protein n=1 Tax=Carpinus fangiana TaxID=176857 RepID=A0A5N6KVI4_9ROSI|nr:hypothetical protein FH972_023387 [Carpinus fangiana]